MGAASIVFSIALASAGVLPAAVASSGPLLVTLGGPPSADVDTPVMFSGSVSLQGLPVPAQSVQLRVGGVPRATTTTDAAGSFSAALSFTTGYNSVEAVVLAGKAVLESSSDIVGIRVGRFPLSVTLAGTGAGSVASSSGGISCMPDCIESLLAGQQVTLAAAAAAGSAFGGWGGDCVGTGPPGPSCTLTGSGNPLTATAAFNDIAAPVKPVTTGVAPASPANNNAPTVSGAAETNSTVRLYLSASCGGAAVATTSATGFSDGVGISVADDSSNTITARAQDAAGNLSACSAPVTYIEDSTAPQTTITAGPPALAPSSSATFSFNSTEISSYGCTLDGGAAAACVSPVSYSGLSDASHTFTVAATDPARNADLTPASRTWVIDTVGPIVTITSAPASPINSSSASFNFNSESGAAASCSLDGSAYASCTSPKSYSGLVDGSHTFSVRATDAAGNTGAVSSHSWTIDTIAPVTTITSGPPSPTNQTSASFYFSSEAGALFACNLDAGAYGACTSPADYTALSQDSHTFSVRASDAAGNTDPSPDTRTFVVDTSAAAATIAFTPAGPANDNAPYASGIAEAGSIVRVYRSSTCNGTPVASVTAAEYASGLTVSVGDDTSTASSARVTDAAGNISACSTATYVEDSTAPLFAAGAVRIVSTARGELTVVWPSASDAVSPDASLVYEICVSATIGSCGSNFTAAATRGGAVRLARVGGLAASTRYEALVVVRDLAGNRRQATAVQGTTLGAPMVTKVTAGGQHSCALISDGTVRCWGWNGVGGLGDGTTSNRLTSVAASGISGATGLAAGNGHTCALISDGTVRCWGDNTFGQLGDGTRTNRSTPVAVSGVSGATGLAAGLIHTCAVISDGTARCWGSNDYGKLGDGTAGIDRPTPVAVRGLSGAVGITGGGSHTCALISDGTARCWGDNYYGQLGDGTTWPTYRVTLVVVSGLSGAVAIAGGGSHTCALITDGTVRCWGLNLTGQLGDGTTTTTRLTPVLVGGLSGAVSIAAGASHTCAVISDRTARCWGYNSSGQLGDGTTTNRISPVAVSGISEAAAVAGGGSQTCALISDGTARCWGDNSYGQLGDGTTTQRLTPVPLSGWAVSVAAGGLHTCALISGGTARCWGNNADGQLGDGTTTNRLTPVVVSGLSGAVAISAGESHVCALISDGTVRCWGFNAFGQLGDGTTTPRTTPVVVSGVSGAIGVSAGAYHTCALISDGTARCWGYNISGGLGDGTTTDRLTPVVVNGLSGAVGVTVGRYHTCALIADGTARCWGDNGYGQLGDGTTAYHPTPVVVGGLSGAVSVTAGGFHTCGLISDGTARCWGNNADGRLGDGTTTTRLTPVAVTGLSGAVAIAASESHVCGLISDGTARCWGNNADGRLGDGTTTTRLTSVAVSVLSGASGVALGGSHTCALISDGTARCWGYNYQGQLGDGTTANRPYPGLVGSFG